LEGGERKRNEKCGMRNELARTAEREVLSENSKLGEAVDSELLIPNY
jgi:hypothetical protein